MATLRAQPQRKPKAGDETKTQSLGVFTRSETGWRQLNAPSWMWDDTEAFECHQRWCEPHMVADDDSYSRIFVTRLRRAAGPRLLATAGVLTAKEREVIDRWPNLHRRVDLYPNGPDWLNDSVL